MGFFRSSESKSSKSKSRFSFRRHSDDANDFITTKPVPAPLPPQTRKQHSSSQPSQSSSSASSSSRPPAHPPATLSATFVSSASTSASSSVTSPSALQRTAQIDSEAENKKSSASKRPSDSLVSTDTDDSEFFPRTPRDSLSTPRGSFDLPAATEHSTTKMSVSSTLTEKVQHQYHHHNTPPSPRDPSLLSRTDSQNSQNGLNSRGQRHSLVGYRQLQCSMSYKNRMATGGDRDDSISSIRSSFSTSGRRSESRLSSHSATSMGSYPHNASNSSLDLIDELAPAKVTDLTEASGKAAASSSSSKTSRSTTSSVDAADASSSLAGGDMTEVRMTEANVAALQTRRAFQQMVLALEDDDSDYDSDSEDYMPPSRNSRSSSSYVGSGGVVQVGANDYRKFQFRLRQLEDMCQEQARKQAVMEETIENEVQTRTKKVVEAMEKKIAIYKQVKDAEVEREIQRRVSEGTVRLSSGRDSVFGAALPPQHPSSLSSSPVMIDSRLSTGKPLEKIFHPRRTRKRMELLREHEERQKKEMEQFREFIRSTEMRSTMAFQAGSFRETTVGASHGEEASARASIKALRDPHITEDLLAASQTELIEMICVLRKHVGVQESQLDEAKKLISAAIEAREEAEEMAKEAVELTMHLDSRLERASQEMVLIKDELRRSSEFSIRSSFLMGPAGESSSSSANSASYYGASLSSSSSNLPRTASFPR